MSKITYDELSQKETILKTSSDNRNSFNDALESSFIIILEGFEGIEQTEKALNFLQANFLLLLLLQF